MQAFQADGYFTFYFITLYTLLKIEIASFACTSGRSILQSTGTYVADNIHVSTWETQLDKGIRGESVHPLQCAAGLCPGPDSVH